MKDDIKLTPKKITFLKTYNQLDDSATLKEILFAHQIQIEKLEKIRSNTSTLVWWLVALPIIFTILFVVMGSGFLIS